MSRIKSEGRFSFSRHCDEQSYRRSEHIDNFRAGRRRAKLLSTRVMLSEAKRPHLRPIGSAKELRIVLRCLCEVPHFGRDDMKNMQTTQRYTLADLEKWDEVARDIDPPIRLGVFGDPVAHSLSPRNAKCRAARLRDQRAIRAFSYPAE